MGAAALPEDLVARASTSSEAHALALARRQLRGQIARLEGELAACFLTAWPGGGLDDGPARFAACGGRPRLLGLGELETVRDELVERLACARQTLARRAREQQLARQRLERMLRDPAGHRFERVTCRELGEPGCGAWQVRPMIGVLGMLMGWWEVKLSSGCPLPRARSSRPRG
ncbi:MAG: hypothetical protein ACRDMX_00445 [Solirubrobacteraceae bacterium]